MGPIETLRFGARTGAAVATTFVLYGALDVETALRPDRRRREVLFRWISTYGRALNRIFGIHVHARGLFVSEGNLYPACDSRGIGRIFVMNHRSGMDIPITLTLVEGNIVSRADLAGWPVIGMAARRVGTLFVDRSSRQSGANVLKTMTRAVKEGHGVMLYPEGTAHRGDEVRTLRAGAFKLAVETGAELIPIGIAYGDHDMSFGDESFLAHMKRVAGTSRLDVGVEVGAPILPEGKTVAELRDETHAAIQSLVDVARGRLQGASQAT